MNVRRKRLLIIFLCLWYCLLTKDSDFLNKQVHRNDIRHNAN